MYFYGIMETLKGRGREFVNQGHKNYENGRIVAEEEENRGNRILVSVGLG